MSIQSKIVIGDESVSVEGFTERTLMSLVFDISQLAVNVERIKISVFTLAKEHGIVPVEVPND